MEDSIIGKALVHCSSDQRKFFYYEPFFKTAQTVGSVQARIDANGGKVNGLGDTNVKVIRIQKGIRNYRGF